MASQQQDQGAEPQPLEADAGTDAYSDTGTDTRTPAGMTGDEAAGMDAGVAAGPATDAAGAAAVADPGASEGPDPGDADGDPAADGGEIRAAERSAQRATALAAAEGFHPLRIRPYVAEPDGEPAETTVVPVIAVDPDGPATTDLGLFPSGQSAQTGQTGLFGAEYALEYTPQQSSPGESLVVRGRHRRRRRNVVVAAGTVVVSALAAGAVAVTGQVMGHERGTEDRSVADVTTSRPDVQLPDDASPASGTAGPAVSRGTAPATNSPTPTASASAPMTPAPSAAPVTSTAPVTSATTEPGSPSTPSTSSGTPTASPSGTVTAPPPSPPAAPPHQPVQPDGPSDTATLRIGDSGSAVVDLQRGLTAVHVYRGRLDGVFDHDLERAVVAFQLWHHLGADPLGTYGPTTRTALAKAMSQR